MRKSHENPSDAELLATGTSWEIVFISLLLLAIESRDARIAWYEANTQLLAAEIDRSWGEITDLRRGRGESRRAA